MRFSSSPFSASLYPSHPRFSFFFFFPEGYWFFLLFVGGPLSPHRSPPTRTVAMFASSSPSSLQYRSSLIVSSLRQALRPMVEEGYIDDEVQNQVLAVACDQVFQQLHEQRRRLPNVSLVGELRFFRYCNSEWAMAVKNLLVKVCPPTEQSQRFFRDHKEAKRRNFFLTIGDLDAIETHKKLLQAEHDAAATAKDEPAEPVPRAVVEGIQPAAEGAEGAEGGGEEEWACVPRQ
eukprot:GHVT01081767.1.p1 GENE.GHVT01081767.1~~GHVT01081767.1.p1  ORF type:complete len:233 (+),score=61.17 GHVT01081767.1:119-817(+)